ncbi:autotransporter outer membrane beta-barrel domain-containing protein [Salmonella enterica subsp. VII serovar 1,40:g,z51:--]|nr:autotransporter outer membrane beta-barrel domain-containing protein [Salmonella enterica subsp. VII str. CFSAN000550]EDU7899884.1 autotransporter outer membrane beta-barrel domain-containing protein [Salmonella enterica subsp. houtenae]EEO7409897.1 autotransporter outer membrane beta-barrel domain-containing protein [Salmonella enterica]QJY68065.1 autotransporter outer membrane beta-barrel domain-containing protein [Salmonella enterica subsp. VII serovar 1,40:g,z51:--]HCL5368323.1 autotrans
MKKRKFDLNHITRQLVCACPLLFLQAASATDTHITGSTQTPVTLGAGDALYVDVGGSLISSGSTEVTATGDASIYIDGRVGYSSNDKDTSDYGNSVYLEGNNYVNISNTGIVMANENRGNAIYIESGDNTIDNMGDIGGINDTQIAAKGIKISPTAGKTTINNGKDGVITGTSGAIYVDSGTQEDSGMLEVNNDGIIISSINGAGIAINSSSNVEIDNSQSGQIVGTFYGIDMNASGGHMDINNEGVIEGTNDTGYGYGIDVNRGSADIVNDGLISGGEKEDGSGRFSSIYLATGGNTVTLGTGSQVEGSINSTHSLNTITLTGTSQEDDDITGFDSLTMKGEDWTLSGDINITGTSADALHVQEGTLTLSGNMTNAGGTTIDPDGSLIAANTQALGSGDIDNSGELILDAGAFALSQQSIVTHSGGVLVVDSGSTLDVGTLTQQQDSELDIFLDMPVGQPIITGDQINLDGTLNIVGISGTPAAQSVTLIDADQAINGQFDALKIAGQDQVDFLNISGDIDPTDNSKYTLSAMLSWYSGDEVSAQPATGSFTLVNPEDSFTVGVALDDTDPGENSDWDGRSLAKYGAGTLILDAQNSYSGETIVNAGTLWLTDNGVIGAAGSQQEVDVYTGAVFGGSGVVNGNVNNQGTISFGDTTNPSSLNIYGDVTNSGSIVSSGTTPGNTLYINGNYIGDNGSLTLNTQLGDDASPTDKLVVTGDTSGNTTLYIQNVDGTGALTNNGIEVVDVGGTSNGAFTQGNQVQIGLYEYRLYQDGGDWYLRSQDTDDGGDSGNGGDDNGGKQYRADIGAYLGNQWMARSLQMQTLFDREGSQYRSANGSLWARFKAGRTDSEAAGGKVDNNHNYSQFQLGSDLMAWTDGSQSVTLGVMGSYINADTDSEGNRGADGSQFSASGNVDGYNLGLYATWFANAKDHSGLYVDSWYQYGIYNNTVDNGDVGSTEYDSSAHAVSLETGWRYDMALSSQNTFSLTPQAQVVWQQYNADSVKDGNGTRIDGQDSHSWTTRLGLRADGKLHKDNGVIQPFVEMNWLYTSDDTAVSFDDAAVTMNVPENRAELKAGIQANISQQWNVTLQAAGQKGSHDYSDLNGSLNLHYRW